MIFYVLSALAALILPHAITADLDYNGVTEEMTPESIIAVARNVADWQLRNDYYREPTHWVNGVGYAGIMALGHYTGDTKYYEAMIREAEKVAWDIGPRKFHADDYCVAQTWIELYQLYGDEQMIDKWRVVADALEYLPQTENLQFSSQLTNVEWCWCDALFMGPPALSWLSKATGNHRYLDRMNQLWWKTTEYLYDTEEKLYYRDSRYFTRREPNGNKTFWSRGNGWVYGGLVRVLDQMPENYESQYEFETLFVEMSEKLLSIQTEDGTWHPSLLDPESINVKETSGTGLYVYGMGWGVNSGLLDRAMYEPAISKAMEALIGCVQPDGKLGYVQPIGAAPDAVSAESTMPYGVGAFLLAATETAKMLGGEPIRYVMDKGNVYGRYVPERQDGFAWENDRIAFRMYGPASQATGEISSGIDVWAKSTNRLVINDWYKNDYHNDNGEGGDFYKVGQSLGCGSSGIWSYNNETIQSNNWAEYNVLERGPESLTFELGYDDWNVDSRTFGETKKITLESNMNLNKLTSVYTSNEASKFVMAIGITKREGEGGQVLMDEANGVIAYWEPETTTGSIGCGIVLPNSLKADMIETETHFLALVKVSPGVPVTYYAGACWSESGQFASSDLWEQHLLDFASSIDK